ncbi:hypothetical protein SB861_56445, partial [Paraburkholderia sp. SIMBA_049]
TRQRLQSQNNPPCRASSPATASDAAHVSDEIGLGDVGVPRGQPQRVAPDANVSGPCNARKERRSPARFTRPTK